MNLDEAILNTSIGFSNEHGDPIRNKTLYSRWEIRHCDTIKEFYEKFIEPRLPSIDICLKWNELLKWYLEQPNIIYFYRGGNNSGKCRRGWLCEQGNTSNNEAIRYIYDDNDLACYIYKMALDEFCPSKEEFYDFMTSFKSANQIGWLVKSQKLANVDNTRQYLSFPGKFTPNEPYEINKNVLLLNVQESCCCLGKYSYKHAHIFDVKGLYTIGSRVISGTKNNKDNVLKAFEVDKLDYDKYIKDPSLNAFIYKRDKVDLKLFDEIKTFLKAETMRFLNPLNHFLSPMEKCNKYTKEDGSIDLDIAEYDCLQKYIVYRKRQLFFDSSKNVSVYEEFEKYILPSKNFVSFTEKEAAEIGDMAIDIIFHEKSIANSIYPGVKALYKEKDGYDKAVAQLRNKKSVKRSNGGTRVNSGIRNILFGLIKRYIHEKNVNSFTELNLRYPSIAALTSNINDTTRYFEEVIKLPNGDEIRISNQIGDKPDFPKNRNFSKLLLKLEEDGITQ